MTTITVRQAWIAFLTIDALLLLGTGSAMAASATPPAIPMHLPAVLLGGLGLLVTTLTGRRAR